MLAKCFSRLIHLEEKKKFAQLFYWACLVICTSLFGLCGKTVLEKKERRRKRRIHGFFEGKREIRKGRSRGSIEGEKHEAMEHMGHEESQSNHPLRFHTSHHRHWHELRAQTTTLSDAQPRLISFAQ